MKKQLLTAAVAIVALAGCTKTEVVKVNESRAISFDSFVGNPTKAVNDINTSGLTSFTLYGAFTKDGKTATVYDEAEATYSASQWSYPLQYWVEGAEYKFAAYSNGNAALPEGSTTVFEETSGTLTINGYTPSDKDLILVEKVSATGKASANDNVNLAFNHLLSKVNFKFSTTFDAVMKVEITDLVVKQVENKANYNNGNWTFESSEKADKNYAPVIATAQGVESEECYIIPQTNTTIVADFKVKVTYEDGSIVAEKNFTGVNLASGNGDKWANGNAYTYVAIIKPENMNVSGEPIVFNPTVIEWVNNDLNDNIVE